MVNHVHIAGYVPQAYKGHVKVDKQKCSIIEIATGREMPPLLQRFGDWVITTEGIDNLAISYPIEKERFDEKLGGHESWIEHMEEKEWCNMSDFSNALMTGKKFVKYGII